MALMSQLGMMFTAKDMASSTINRVDKNLKDVAGTAEATAARYEQSMTRIRRGAMMLGVAVVGLMAMTSVTKAAGEFQHTLASAGVIMGATASEMRSLERAAIDAGIATQFSPKEAAEGLQSLGAAGMNAQQAITALNPVLDLAAASLGQLGVAGAAENVVGVLNAFSMQADQARDVADKLTRITQLTNFQFRDFSVAISQSASQASAADQSFESLLATLGMLRNANVHASVAATSYREAVRRLAGDEGAHKQLKKLKIEVMDQETRKIRDLGSIMADVAPKLEAMNSKEKNLTLTRIFGVRGMKTYSAFVSQYNKLVKDGVVEVGDYAGAHRRLVTELNNASGAAVKNRDALLQTAEGQRQLLKGSWETTQIMLGKLAIPAILPAMQALTNTLNVFIQVINAIPGPVRELMGTFGGAFLAFRALRGGVILLRGAFGLLQLNKVTKGVEEIGEAADGAGKKVTFMSAQMSKMGTAGRAGIQILQSWASAATIAIPIAMGVISYFQGKHAEEIRRQKEIRQQNVATMQSYMQALDMAKALRRETAKALADELNANTKTEAGARKVLDSFRVKYAQLSKEVDQAQRRYLDAAKQLGMANPEVRKLRAEFIKTQGKYEAVTRAVIAAEARAAQFEIGRAKGADREMLARKVIADRVLREQVQRRNLSKFQEDEQKRLAGYSGKQLTWEKRRSDARIRREALAIKQFGRETARMAVRWKLADRDVLNERGRQRKLTEIAGGAILKPTVAERVPTGYVGHLRGGRLPPGIKSLADLERLRRQIAREKELTGEVFPIEGLLPLARRRLEAGMPAIPTAEETTGITLPSISLEPPSPAELAYRQPQGADIAGMTEVLRTLPEAISRGKPPVIVQVTMDGEKIAQVVTSYQDRGERDQDGTETITASTGVQGAG